MPEGSDTRIGIDRDEDGVLDRDELDACSAPADPESLPGLDVAVPHLVVGRSEAGTGLSWNDAGASWDVVVGDLDLLRETAGDYSVAVLACLVENGTQPSAVDPGGGQATFYLVRAACAGGTTYESAGSGQTGLRDEEIDAAPGSCSDG